MGKFAATHMQDILTGHFVVRLLIVSYFIAHALGLIGGTDLSVLAASLLPPLAANVVSGFFVLGLSVMILFGFHRRLAALLLAIMLFWSSYLGLINPNGLSDISGFWRDLALIGALLLTYADAQTNTFSSDYRTLPQGGRIGGVAKSGDASFANRQASRSEAAMPSKTPFHEDFEIVRAS